MNRTGQPPQRTPSIGPNPALTAPFRGPFPAYGMPPRNVMPGFPSLPNHRTTQNIVPQPSPNYLQQRGQGNFPFTGTLQQLQSQPPSQHTTQTQTPIPHTPLQPQQPNPPPSSNASGSLPPHIAQNQLNSLGTTPSTSSSNDVGLDPNDFPALGSAPANNVSTPSTTTTSYASQAGTGAGLAVAPGQGSNVVGSQQRDFTAEDFPALGGQTQSSQTQSQPPSAIDGHPPGLNGFQQHSDQLRQNLLGTRPGQQQPGLLNIGQARSGHGGFQSETEKRNQSLKLNQSNLAAAAAAWNSPSPNTGTFPAATSNGTHSNHIQSSQPLSAQPPSVSQPQHPGAPPGVPPPVAFSQAAPGAAGLTTPFIGNGNVPDTPLHPSQSSAQSSGAVPQTAAQQVLMSPADKWGLLALLAMIKSTDLDTNLLSVGTDLGTMGLDMQTPGLYSTFITPWADSSAAHSVEPDFHLPSCYSVTAAPPGPIKTTQFSDDTLFFMFYSSPRDALQEVAAQELYNRSWRFHKSLHIWIIKENGAAQAQKMAGGEHGTYIYWDVDNWVKARKELTVMYADIEEKTIPMFAPSSTLQLANNQPPPTPSSQPQATPAPIVTGRQFQGLGVAAM